MSDTWFCAEFDGSQAANLNGASIPMDKEAGRLAAVAATVALCRSLLLVMTGPLPRSGRVRQPQDASAVLAGMDGNHAALREGKLGSVAVARQCKHLPTNAFVAKRMHAGRQRRGRGAQGPTERDEADPEPAEVPHPFTRPFSPGICTYKAACQ